MKIGILGGTFNPIHNGHINIAKEALVKLDLDKVLFIPSGNPPHKKILNTKNKDYRYEMVKIAISNQKGFEISDIEYANQGYSYSIDTVSILKKIYNHSKLYFITGEDSIFDVPNWKKGEFLLKEIDFIVAKRKQNTDDLEFKNKLDHMEKKYGCNIIILENDKIDISSSEIRNMVKNGMSITGLVDPKVEKYIYDNNIYKVGQ